MVSKNSYFLLSHNKKCIIYDWMIIICYLQKVSLLSFFGNNKNNWRPIKTGQGGERASLYHSHLLALLVVQCHTV